MEKGRALGSDESIIKEIQSGNVSLYEEIVRRYQRPFFAFLYHMVADFSLCEDLVQETFVKIYKAIDRVDTSKKFSTYAFEIAKNTAFSYLRSHKVLVSLSEVEIEADEDLYEKVVDEEAKTKIRKTVNKLRQSYKNVISLYYFKDLSYEEIAKKMHLPVNTIRTHLRRARLALKEML